MDLGDRRRDRGDAGGGADCDGQRVVHDEGRAGDQPRRDAEVLHRHLVGAAALGVGANRLPV